MTTPRDELTRGFYLVADDREPRNPLIPVAWVFTFGLDHPLARRYVRLVGDENECRELMTEIFGQGRWAGCYREDRASRVIDRGRLTLLDLGLDQ